MGVHFDCHCVNTQENPSNRLFNECLRRGAKSAENETRKALSGVRNGERMGPAD